MKHKRRKRNSINTAIDVDKTQLMDKKLIDKASLWILRIILNLRGHDEIAVKNVSTGNVMGFLAS